MKRYWPFINSWFLLLTLIGGFFGKKYQQGSETLNWNAIGTAAAMLVTMPTALVAFGLSRSGKTNMARPTWDRHPFGWWTDTLQPLRASTLLMAALALGAVARLPDASAHERMIIFGFLAMAVALIAGEGLAYTVFKRRIAPKGENP